MIYSVSSVETFFKCKKDFNLKYMEKVKIPDKQSIERFEGIILHNFIENNLSVDKDKFKKEIDNHKDLINNEYLTNLKEKYKILSESSVIKDHLRNNGVNEEKFYIDTDLNLHPDRKSLLDKGDGFTGAIDYHYFISPTIIQGVDWKFGKYRSHLNINLQTIAYALYFFLKYPNVDIVLFNIEYIFDGKTNQYKYERDKFFNSYVYALINKLIMVKKYDGEFSENESVLCKWCDYYKTEHCGSKYKDKVKKK